MRVDPDGVTSLLKLLNFLQSPSQNTMSPRSSWVRSSLPPSNNLSHLKLPGAFQGILSVGETGQEHPYESDSGIHEIIIHLPVAQVEAIRAEIGRLLGQIQVRKEPGKAIARPGASESRVNGSGGRIRTYDLRVMSPTSCQTAPPRNSQRR